MDVLPEIKHASLSYVGYFTLCRPPCNCTASSVKVVVCGPGEIQPYVL